MDLPRFQYTKNWENPADFPTHEYSEAQVRRDIQTLFAEIETYLNRYLLPTLEAVGLGSIGITGDFLPRSGGQMTGPLLLSQYPAVDMEAATKQYVDVTGGLIQRGVDGALAAITVDLDRIQLAVRNAEGKLAVLELTADGLLSEVSDLHGNVSQILQTLDSISLTVSREVDGESVYARITLKIGPNNYEGRILMEGNVEIKGDVAARSLYAARGEIADLAVDRFSTSRRIVKYLAGDTSDDCFIRMEGQYLQFVAGIRQEGEPLQAANPMGEPLCWEADVVGLPRGEDGYPLLDGERVFTTTKTTPWPVYVYRYEEQVKRCIRFTAGPGGIYEPVDTYGAGNASGYNIGTVYKGTEGFELRYLTPTGRDIGIRMTTDGFVDVTGFRRTTALDFSGWEGGSFSETVEGGGTVRYTVSFDASGRPTAITDTAADFTVSITW